MKIFYSALAAIFLFTAAPSGHAAVSLSINFFHDNLDPYGDWRQVGDYGYCWQPRDVDVDWRPYSDGRWVYTDAGWTWDSDEPYGWAVYHYGRWVRVARVGWVWVPGTEWGPAWVSWRRSPSHVGWAPLPPEARFVRTAGFTSRVDVVYDIGPSYYNFVTVRDFGAPRLRTVIVEPRQNINIIRETTNITRITYVNNVVYNQGPQYDVISQESAQPIRRLKLDRRADIVADPGSAPAEQFRTRVEGDALQVPAPVFETKAATAPRKVAARVEKAEVDRGWKDAGPAEEVTKLRKRMKNEPATVAEVPPAKSEKSAVAAPADTEQPDQPGKGKAPKTDGAAAPIAPAQTDTAPPEAATPDKPGKGTKPEKTGKVAPMPDPAVSEQPQNPEKPKKGAKPVKPEAGNIAPKPPQTESAPPPSAPKKGKKPNVESPRPPVESAPQEKAPESKGKAKKIAPPNNPPPAPVAPVQAPQEKKSGKGKGAPKQPDARPVEHSKPAPPEAPRPEKKKAAPAPPPAPSAAQPAAPQPTKEKGGGKGKGDKKDKDQPPS